MTRRGPEFARDVRECAESGYTAAEIAAELGVKPWLVYAVCSAEGIEFNRRHRRWTGDEDAAIARLARAAAERLNRTPAAVANRMRQLSDRGAL